MESCRKCVSLLFLYGTCCLCSASAPRTSARAERLLFMFDASLSAAPVTPDIPVKQGNCFKHLSGSICSYNIFFFYLGLMAHQDYYTHLSRVNYKAKNIYMCVSGFSSEKTRYGRSALQFFLSKYLIWILHFFFQHFSTFSSIFDNILLTIHNKMFRVGAKP